MSPRSIGPNRAQRTINLLEGGATLDSCTLTGLLGTGAFRAVCEARKLIPTVKPGYRIEKVGTEEHNGHFHGVYQIVPLDPVQTSLGGMDFSTPKSEIL